MRERTTQIVMEPLVGDLTDDVIISMRALSTPEEAVHYITSVMTYLQEHLPDSKDYIKMLLSIKCYLAVLAEDLKRQRKDSTASGSLNMENNFCEDIHNKEAPTDEINDLLINDRGKIQHVVDHSVSDDNEEDNRAINTLPSCLSVRRSQLKPDAVGVFTNVLLTDSVYFGPYEGKMVENPESCISTSWLWQITGQDGKEYYIDGHDSSKANWMRYVHCTNAENHHNLKALQYDGEIFYKVTRTITPGTELIVCYEYTHHKQNESEESSTDDVSLTCQVRGTTSTNDKMFVKVRRKDVDANQSKHFRQSSQYYKGHTRGWMTRSSHHSVKNKHDCFDPESGKFKCQTCSKEFALFSQYRYHERQHTGEKPYQCSDCGRCFRVIGHLRVHQLTHTNNKPYSCRFCSRRFTQSSNLTRHLRIHTGEKPHQCLYCEKRFADATTFKCHQRIHTGERPYKCKLCGQGFISSSRRKTHMLSHSQLRHEQVLLNNLNTPT